MHQKHVNLNIFGGGDVLLRKFMFRMHWAECSSALDLESVQHLLICFPNSRFRFSSTVVEAVTSVLHSGTRSPVFAFFSTSALRFLINMMSPRSRIREEALALVCRTSPFSLLSETPGSLCNTSPSETLVQQTTGMMINTVPENTLAPDKPITNISRFHTLFNRNTWTPTQSANHAEAAPSGRELQFCRSALSETPSNPATAKTSEIRLSWSLTWTLTEALSLCAPDFIHCASDTWLADYGWTRCAGISVSGWRFPVDISMHFCRHCVNSSEMLFFRKPSLTQTTTVCFSWRHQPRPPWMSTRFSWLLVGWFVYCIPEKYLF